MKGGTRKRGSTWSYYFDMGTVAGKRQKKEKGGFHTKKEAEAALAQAISEYNSGGSVFEPSTITISDYLDLWFDKYCRMNLKYNTQADYLATIKNHLKPQFGKYRLRTLTTVAVQEYADNLKKQGYARATLVNIICTLSASCNYAVEPLHYIQFNPCDRVKIPKYENGRQEMHVFLDPDQIRRILDRFPADTPHYIPIMIGYYTGVRISECYGLTWDDIDLEAGTITIDHQVVKRNYGDVRDSLSRSRHKMEKSLWYFQSPKTETSNRTIRIGPTLLSALKATHHRQKLDRLKYGDEYTEHYLKPETDEKGNTIQQIISVPRSIPVDLPSCDLVCVRSDGSMLTPDSFKYVCRIVQHDLGMPFNYHSLRHTHATMLIQAGAPIKDVQERLGHANIATTMNAYVHNTDAMRSETVALFEQASGQVQ